MKSWLRGRVTAILGFLIVSGLVLGGLGWVTDAVLRLEQEQIDARDKERHLDLLRPALWQLDSNIAPILAREDSRPWHHYMAVYPPPVLFRNDKTPIERGTVLEPSPLQSEEFPEWMRLHFWADATHGWDSPQILSQELTKILNNPKAKAPLDNVTEERNELRRELAGCWTSAELLTCVKQKSEQQRWVNDRPLLEQNLAALNQPVQTMNAQDDQTKAFQYVVPQGQQGNLGRGNSANDFLNRAALQKEMYQKKDAENKEQQESLGLAYNNLPNGEAWFSKKPIKPTAAKTPVHVGSMVKLWLTPKDEEERLLAARLVKIGDQEICQGIVLDWPKLQGVLHELVKEDFPQAQFKPQRDPMPLHPERTMTALPVEMDPGPPPPAEVERWTPLRIGLALAWAAALVALSAVGLGGWSLLDLSERRIRFVSAVTHELRTPLTTLRLYLDMMAGGLVKEEAQQTQYLQTLHAETDRLNRLVGNVLDFSRLENQRPRLEKTTVPVAELLEQVRANWQGRCQSADKQLIVENLVKAEATIQTDVNIAQQILANLIDNACKYSKDAFDKRIWLRARAEGDRLVLEVEDRGPGVPVRERRSIFRPFRRGHGADVTAGGVGLGLALARQWARLLGGRLTLGTACRGSGACFRVELPS